MPDFSAPTPLSATCFAVHYTIEPLDVYAHLYHIHLTIERPHVVQEVRLPAWIPGSYLIREFAKNLQCLEAFQGQAPAQETSTPTPLPLRVSQLSKDHWRIDHCDPEQPLQLRYQVCAYDPSVRAAWLDAQRGFFNATSLCLQVQGYADAPCDLTIRAPQLSQLIPPVPWACASALTPVQIDSQGFGRYRAADYDELADCPFTLGPFWSAEFEVRGIAHRFIVSGAPATFDGARLVQDAHRICEEALNFWHPEADQAPPFAHYTFMLHASHEGYGGLEHRNSTALLCSRRDLPRQGQPPAQIHEGYTTLLGLISHEYFHAWNVKRLRPAEFARYRYGQENYTALLWFFEGFTSYYDDLLLRRAALIDDKTYLKLLSKTINQVMQTPGRKVQSLAQASWDAWIKYYRTDENTPNATVSYYSKGALVALCLDLSLRQAGGPGYTTLDAVLRGLWQRCAAGPMQQADLLVVLETLSGRSWAAQITEWVHTTHDLPLAELLTAQGVTLKNEVPPLAQRLGVRVQENHGIQIKTVLRDSPAEQAGFMAGDEWIGLEVQGQGWRLHKLDDCEIYAEPGQSVTAWVAREARLLPLALTLPASQRGGGDSVQLTVNDSALVQRWLAVQALAPAA